MDGVVGDFLCERYGDLKENPLTIEVKDNRIVDLRSENKDLRDDFRSTPAPTKTATGSVSLRSAPTLPAPALSATFCRTKRFQESISLLAIPTPSTRPKLDFEKHISTASGATSTSGSTTKR